MFDKRISILVPYKSDGGYRDRNWHWVKERYKALMPNAEICIGNYESEPFSRASAINNAARLATRDIFIIADADIIFDMSQIAQAVLGLTYFPWIIPYTTLNYLTLEQTNSLQKLEYNIHINNIGFTGYRERDCKYIFGGISVVPREHFEKVGGFDERFKGWGAEDDAFQRSLDVLCGHHGRIRTALWHMYHPPAPKNNFSNNEGMLKRFYGSKDSIIAYFNKKNND